MWYYRSLRGSHRNQCYETNSEPYVTLVSVRKSQAPLFAWVLLRPPQTKNDCQTTHVNSWEAQ